MWDLIVGPNICTIVIYCWVERHLWEPSGIPVKSFFFFSTCTRDSTVTIFAERELFSCTSFPWQNGRIRATWYCALTDTRLPAESCRIEKRNQKVTGGLEQKARVGIYLATYSRGTNAHKCFSKSPQNSSLWKRMFWKTLPIFFSSTTIHGMRDYNFYISIY